MQQAALYPTETAVNYLVRVRSRMLILTVSFSIAALFFALMMLEPVPQKAAQPAAPPAADTVRSVLGGLGILHVLLLAGVLAFHFSNRDVRVPFMVLSGVLLVLWFVAWIASLVYMVYANRRAAGGRGNTVRTTALATTTLLFLGNVIYFLAGVAMDRRAQDLAMERAMAQNLMM